MNKGKLWLLDNGHGGIIDGEYQTKGKRSPEWPNGEQLFEGEFNRAIVKRLAILMDEAGYEYVIVADTEEDMPLSTRVQIANEYYKHNKNAIYLSIHANAGGGTGWEVFTSKGETKSDKYATVFYNKAVDYFPQIRKRTDITDGDPDKESQFYVLRKTNCPSVLTENFFMDTYEPDCKILLSEEGRDEIAKMHFAAIQEIEKNFK